MWSEVLNDIFVIVITVYRCVIRPICGLSTVWCFDIVITEYRCVFRCVCGLRTERQFCHYHHCVQMCC